jgi:hypothetical protein
MEDMGIPLVNLLLQFGAGGVDDGVQDDLFVFDEWD